MSTATTETKKASPAPKAVAVIFGIPLVIGLMLFAFLAPTFASGPNDVPIALTAPPQYPNKSPKPSNTKLATMLLISR